MIGLFFILGAFAVFIVIATLVFHWRMRKHHGVSREEFITAFADAAIPAEIPAAVYDYYKKGMLFKEFSIAPDDSYRDVLREGEEDIEDDARFLMKKLSLKPPSEEAQRHWNEQALTSRATTLSTPRFSVDSSRWMQPIQTVREMVLWLNWVRQHQQVAAPK